MPIVVIGLNHQTAPITVRERFAFADSLVPETLARMKSEGLIQEGVILSTCNRVEIYAATEGNPVEAGKKLVQFLTNFHSYEEVLTDEIYSIGEPLSVQHLFKVACGLDSMVLGETEILGQLKKAYDLALQHKHTGPRLNKAFQRAFNVAKQIRTETNIQRGNTSVASVAVELAEKIFNTLQDRQVMVVGAGETSEKTARALLGRGARSIIVSNRSFDRAEVLAKELGGRAIPFEDWAAEFDLIDIVISSTSAPHYVLDRPKLELLIRHRRGRPLLLVDIAVPRDIDPEVNMLDNVYLYNVDDLQSIADESLKQRQDEIKKCLAIIESKSKAFLQVGRFQRQFDPFPLITFNPLLSPRA